MKRFCVYGIYDEADSLVYVGCSGSLEKRIKAHKRRGRLAKIYRRHSVLSWHNDRRSALDRETAMIFSARPVFNKNGKNPAVESITFSADPGTIEALDKLALANNLSRSAQIFELIEPHIAGRRKNPARKTGKK